MRPAFAYLVVTLSTTTRIEQGVVALPCVWDKTITGDDAERQNCGYRCPNPWGAENPHYCGPPDPCCCAPKCNITVAQSNAFIGVNWNDRYMKRPLKRRQQMEILKASGFYHIKTFSPAGLKDIREVYGKKGRVYVGIPNKELTRLATEMEYARRYVRENLVPYSSNIEVVVVGNEPLICMRTAQWAQRQECGSLNLPRKLLPAMKNVYDALILEGMKRRVTTAFNGGILEMSENPWTPCISDYKEFVKPFLEDVWAFLRKTKGPFVVNLYSWFATIGGHISPKVACGFPDLYLPHDGRYNYYFNFDMQLDMQRVAMCKNNITDLELWVGETGWPTGGHLKATRTNAYYYLENTVRRAKGLTLNNESLDTPRLKGIPFSVFLFEAFDEMKKSEIEHGNMYENSFGLFYEDGVPKWRNAYGRILLDIPGEREHAYSSTTTTSTVSTVANVAGKLVGRQKTRRPAKVNAVSIRPK